jgi:hypothetical protein
MSDTARRYGAMYVGAYIGRQEQQVLGNDG